MTKARIEGLLAADMLTMGAFSLLSPILPLFLAYNMTNATIQNIATAFAMYFFSQGCFGYIMNAYQDHNKSERATRLLWLAGAAISTSAPLYLLKATDMPQAWIVMLAMGAGMGVMRSAWHHMIKHKSGEEAGAAHEIQKHLSLFAKATMAALGGFITYQFGFEYLVAAMVVAGLVGIVVFLAATVSPIINKKKIPVKMKKTGTKKLRIKN